MTQPSAPPAYGPPPGGYPGGHPGQAGAYPAPPGPPAPTGRPRTPWWAVVLAVLGVVTVVLALAGVVGALVYQTATRTSEVAVEESGVRELRIVGVTGGASVSTEPSDTGAVTGTARLTTSWNTAEVTVDREGDVLVLTARCADRSWPRRCEVVYDLQVDPGTDVVVDLVTGGFEADGLAGDVEVDLTTGGVMLSRSASSRVDVSVTTGGVVLDFVRPPTDVQVSTVTGGIGIGLPDDGEAYDVSTDVTVGGAEVTVPRDPSSPRTVEAATTVGGIEVRPGPVDEDGPGRRP